MLDQQETFSIFRELPDDMLMPKAMEAILQPLELSEGRLARVALSVRYQNSDGCAGYDEVVDGRTLGAVLSNRARIADTTQDATPSLYISLYHGRIRLPTRMWDPTLNCGNKMPESVTIDIVHNITLYHRQVAFSPTVDTSTSITDYVLENMVSQGNQGESPDLDKDNVVVFYNGRIPMIQGVPIGAYSMMYGIETADEMNQPILISFDIIGAGKKLGGPSFVAAWNAAAPVVLTYDALNAGSNVVATYQLVQDALSNPDDAPISDRRYVYLCNLARDLEEAKIKENHPSPWIKRIVRALKNDQSWRSSLEASEHDDPTVYSDKSDYYLAFNHLSTR